MNDHHYRVLKWRLDQLLSLEEENLSPEDGNWIQEFVDVGEYGLALLTFSDVILRDKKQIESQSMTILEEIACRMGMEDEVKLAKLKQCVRSSGDQ